MDNLKTGQSNNSFIFLVIFLAIIAVMVSMILVNKKPKSVQNVQDIKPNTVVDEVNKTGTTSLYFSPASQNVAPGDSIVVKAYMNTGSSLITGIELKTVYDPGVFEVMKVTKEPIMNGLSQEIRNEVDNTIGVFNYSTFGLDKQSFLNGSNLFLFSLEVKVKETAEAGVYSFDFDPNTTISASGVGKNVFKESTPQKITVSP